MEENHKNQSQKNYSNDNYDYNSYNNHHTNINHSYNKTKPTNKSYYKNHYNDTTDHHLHSQKNIKNILIQIENKSNSMYSIPELTKNLIDDLINSKYECLICNEILYHDNEIWNCDGCYSMLHIKCISDWAIKKNPNCDDKLYKNDIIKFPCPHCSKSIQTSFFMLQTYNCFCLKYNSGVKIDHSKIKIPHSCGIICNKNQCDHIKCLLPCHPGPHLICKAKTFSECFCGKIKLETICCIGKKSNKFSCGGICNKSLICGNHYCQNECHLGECPENSKDSKCFECVKESKSNFKYSIMKEIVEVSKKLNIKNIEFFSDSLSDYVFEGTLPCKIHFVESNPEQHLKNILRLFKISGENILINLRKIIPICKEKIENSCACKSISEPGQCFQINYQKGLLEFLYKDDDLIVLKKQIGKTLNKDENLKEVVISKIKSCGKICKTLKNCKTHYCLRECCYLKGDTNFNYNNDPKGLHLCHFQCGKVLSCGKHECISLCHKGNCLPCHEIIRDVELVCDCGRTKINPPYKCYQEVICDYNCMKERQCPHKCELKCHRKECPPCLERVSKKCECEQTILNNIQCSEKGKCDIVCNEILPCGVHFCIEKCHTHIEEDGFICKKQCGRKMKCGHICQSECHGEDDCEYSQCNLKTRVNCKCLSKSNSKVMKCIEIQKKNDEDKNENRFDINILECNDECIKQSRLKLIEKSFLDLKSYSDSRMKKYYKIDKEKDDSSIRNDLVPEANIDKNKIDINEYEQYCQFKFTSQMIKYSKIHTNLISDTEDYIENYLCNISNSKSNSTLICEKKELDFLSLFIYEVYNIKHIKCFNKSTYKGNITFTDVSSARLPRYRLSLFGLLFRYNKFLKKEYNQSENEEFRIYHPFEQSIMIKDLGNHIKVENVEYHLKNKLSLYEDDFYVDEDLNKDLFYIHFFNGNTCRHAFEINRQYSSEFQNCYLFEEYSQNHVDDDSHISATIFSKDVKEKVSNMYKYKHDTKYFKLIYDQYDQLYYSIIEAEKKRKNQEDDDGFVTVYKKKK